MVKKYRAKSKLSIKTKILSVLAGIFLLICVMFIGVFCVVMNILTQRIYSDIESYADSRKDHIQNIIEEDIEQAKLIAMRALLQEYLSSGTGGSFESRRSWERIADILEDITDIVPSADRIDLIDPNGKTVISSDLDTIGKYGREHEYLGGEKEYHISEPYLKTGLLFYDVCAPVFHPDKTMKKIGSVRMVMNCYKILNVLRDSSRLGKTAENLLVYRSKDGTLYMGLLENSEDVLTKIPLTEDTQGYIGLKIVNFDLPSGVITGKDYEGNKTLAGYSTVGITGWKFIAKIDKDELFQDIYNLYPFMGLILIGILFTGALSIYFLLDRLILPIEELKDSVQNITRGDFTRRITYKHNGEIAHLMECFNDMTKNLSELMVDKTLLQQEIEKKEKISRSKDEIVSIVSHELRNPLSVMILSFSVAKEAIDNKDMDEVRKFIEIAQKSSDFLLKIVNDILDLSKIESGFLRTEKTVIDLKNVINSGASYFQHKSLEKGLELKTVFKGDEFKILANEDYILRVFINLISNAVKFTPKGSIEISAIEKEDEIECCVADTGIGIAPEDINKVFQKFSYIKKGNIAITEKGTGLGLSIIKEIINEHGGNIRVESISGKGTQFIITLPKSK
ncbi:MAG: ATP-binding protein [bacterium]